jgi:hypothetical protein
MLSCTETGVGQKLAFDGSHEITPYFPRDIDSLRRVSFCLVWALLLGGGLLIEFCLLSKRSPPVLCQSAFGAVILPELAVHVRHLRNFFRFRTSRTEDVRGRIENSRKLLLRLSSAEIFAFSGLFLFLFPFLREAFLLGGIVRSFLLAIKHLRLARGPDSSSAVPN